MIEQPIFKSKGVEIYLQDYCYHVKKGPKDYYYTYMPQLLDGLLSLFLRDRIKQPEFDNLEQFKRVVDNTRAEVVGIGRVMDDKFEKTTEKFLKRKYACTKKARNALKSCL